MVAFVFAGRMRRAGRLVLAAAAVVLVVSCGGVPVARAGYRDCSLKTLKACENMNQLIWAKDFRKALTVFVGDDDYWSEAIFGALGGPPDKPRWLGPDSVRFSGCRAHDCGFKGAVFLSADGRILQAAVLDFSCREPRCVDHYTVYVLTHDPNPELIRYAKEWAYEALEIDPAKGRRYNGYWDVTLEGVKVIRLP